jgi:RNA polymerase sigma factor (sigma-70 family)
MDDHEVVAAIAADDPAGIAMAYDRYAAALYDYCHWMLRQPTDAAEALQHTYVIAATTIRDLPEAPELRPWLYSIARRECLCHLRTSVAAGDGESRATEQRDETAQQDAADLQPIDATLMFRAPSQPIDATLMFRAPNQPADSPSQPIDATLIFRAVDAADGLTDVNRDLEQAEPRKLICAALADLKPREREVLELNLRHGLDDADLATALGVSLSQALVLASRARSRMEKALGALLAARIARDTCPALREVLSDWDGRLTKETSDLVGVHIEQCEGCAGQHQGTLRPAALSSLLPLASLPAGHREQVMRLCSAADASSVAYRRRADRSPESVSRKRIWPTIRMQRWASIRGNPGMASATVVVVAWVVTAVSVSVLAFVGPRSAGVLTAGPIVQHPPTSPAASVTATASPVVPSPSASPKPSPRVSRARTATPSPVESSPTFVEPSRSPKPSPSPSRSPKPSNSPSPAKSPSPTTSPSPSSSGSASPSPSGTS